MRLLIWLVIAFAVVTWIKRTFAGLTKAAPGQSRPPNHPQVETMVLCIRCGVHIPASEAVAGSKGAVFCCEEHRVQQAKLDIR